MPAPKGSANALKHGVFAENLTTIERLQPEKINRLVELRQLVKTEPGRLEIREELTARMALIVDLGFSHLAQQQAEGDDIFATAVLKRLQGYVAETRRLLDSFEELEPGFNAEHERIRKVLDAEPIRKHIDQNGSRADSG